MPPGKRHKEVAAVHRPSVTPSEFALFCWLRLHPKEAETYGIEKCDGETTIGSMLLQTLRSQGMDVDAAQVAGGLSYMQIHQRRVPLALFHRAAHWSFHQPRRGEWLRQRKAASGFLGGVVAAPLLGCLSERGIVCRRDVFWSCGRGLHACAALRELRRDESPCRA